MGCVGLRLCRERSQAYLGTIDPEAPMLRPDQGRLLNRALLPTEILPFRDVLRLSLDGVVGGEVAQTRPGMSCCS
jgi:hypothetical protein